MTPTWQHVVLTRFNVRSPGREARIRARDGWLQGRFELFEAMCLPTVAAQTDKNFVWMVFFDKETDASWRARIDGYRSFPGFRPYFVDYEELTRYKDIIADLFPDRPEWLLTTTLDNDDGWHRDFVRHLHANITFDAPQVLNFSNGLILNDGRVYLRRDESNAFASAFEPFAGMRTIWAEQHIHLDRLGVVKQIDIEPMWLQVVHGGNVSNRVRGKRIMRGAALEAFPIKDATPVTETNFDILLDQVGWQNYRAGREAAIKVYKYFRTMVRGSGPI